MVATEEFNDAAAAKLLAAGADFFVDRVCRRNSDVKTFLLSTFDAEGDADETRPRRQPRLRTMSG